MLDVQLVVLAKAPVAGRVKTRLCPPLTPEQAAAVAAAALGDTLAAVERARFRRQLVALDGDPRGVVPDSFELLHQRGTGLDQRLAAASEDAFAGSSLPLLLIGMDTPQLTPVGLSAAAQALIAGASVLGLARDGGWWAIGLPAPDQTVFTGVPMSTSWTGRAQRARMIERGLDPVALPVLQDIDEVGDLVEVAAAMPPASRLAAVVRDLPPHVLIGPMSASSAGGG